MVQWVKKEAGDDSPGQYYIDDQGIEQYSAIGEQVDEWGYGPEEKYNEDLGWGSFAPKNRVPPTSAMIIAALVAFARVVHLLVENHKKKEQQNKQRMLELEARTDKFVKDQQTSNPSFDRKDVVYTSTHSFFNFWKKNKDNDVHITTRTVRT